MAPSTGVSFGALLGLTAFTTYNWLTQFDSIEAHLRYPLSVAAVFAAKRRAFLLLGVPTAFAYYGLAGLEPNEFLFDTVLFAAFAGAVSLGPVPVLIVGFVLAPLGPILLVAVSGWGLLLAGAGWLLYRQAVPRWEARYRRR